MAAITLTVRLPIEFRLLTSQQRVEDLSDPQDQVAGENTNRTSAYARSAAALVRSRRGDVGAYDDTDLDVGDIEALQWGARWMMHMYRTAFQLIPYDRAP